MLEARRILPRVLVPVLVAVAIAGYVIGAHRGAATPPATSSAGETRIASGPSVLLEYPAGWQPAKESVQIPGLRMRSALLLAPGGDAHSAGLLSGQLAAGGSSPLPAAFVELVRGVPRTEVVTLNNVQAFRYRGLSGYGRTLDVYVIPATGSSRTALVCYAASASSDYLRQCGQIVAKVTLVGQSQYDLSPEAAYADELGRLIAKLDDDRRRLRERMHAHPPAVGALARTLAGRFAATASAVAALEPPLPASAAQTALAGALIGARDAYAALAATAAGEGARDAAGAERRIAQAESSLDTALESFALLGYRHS